MKIGTVVGVRLGKNAGGERIRKLLSVVFEDPEDVQTVELYEPPGEDSDVPLNSKVMVLNPTEGWKIAVGVDDLVQRISADGNKRIYAPGGGGEVRFLKSGNVQLNGNGKKLVTHAELKTALEEMATYINSTFLTLVTGPGVTANITAGALQVDIDDAKLENVDVGGGF